MPADSGLDEKVVLLGAVSADLAKRNLQTFGANPGGFGQDFAQIGLTQGETAEALQAPPAADAAV